MSPPNLFNGNIFSITVNSSQGDTDESIASNGDGVTYNNMKRIIEQLGGKVSSTVHKKVDYIIASDCAVGNATQRIRKAHKFSIPVLRVDYITFCNSNHKLPSELTPYLFDNIDEVVRKHKKSASNSTDVCNVPKKRKAIDVDDEQTIAAPLQTSNLTRDDIVFECSCICHDNGESSCSWCHGAHTEAVSSSTDTSYSSDLNGTNKKSKKRKSKQKSNIIN